MKSKTSKLIAIILGILLPFVLPMCTNPLIEDSPEIIPLSGVSLNSSTLALVVSETEALLATVRSGNAVTWTSSDDFIASVSNSGLITALAEGDATITVTTVDGNHAASCSVTVKESTGEADAPFLIHNELELRQVGTGTDGWNLSAYYKLAADIELALPAPETSNWTPIGTSAKRFTGSFNGNNKTITGLIINNPNATSSQGMFGSIGAGGEVKNLTLAGCNVYGKTNVGGVAGSNGLNVTAGNSGTVRNCYATGNVSGNVNVGGVMGISNGTVENSYATGAITGNNYVGGVVGRIGQSSIPNPSATVKNCYATGNVEGTTGVGGVIGYILYTGIVKNSYATGNITGNGTDGTLIGGVAGHNIGTVENCYATGIVSGNDYVGGVVGHNQGIVISCVALNPNINSTTGFNGNYGRIGYATKSGLWINNYAREDMELNYSRIGAVPNYASEKHGANITAAHYHLQSWWNSIALFDFRASGVWEWHNASRLPVLKGLGVKK
jgi:hypothetical protein